MLTEIQDYPDYFIIIKRPICMKQIKRKIDKDPTYTLPTFKADMHLLWDNARTYNTEGSWVYDAADTMQEAFDKLYDEQVNGGAASSGVQSGFTSQGGSGTSTPMFKAGGGAPAAAAAAGGTGTGTKIKLNLGTKLKAQAAQAQSVASGTASMSGSDTGNDDEDDDY